MRDSSREDKSDNLHIVMWVHAESLMLGNNIIIEHAKCPKMHIVWVIIVCKRKEMFTEKPRVMSRVSTTSRDNLDIHNVKYRQKECRAND